jgi:heme-degrading monooxygenase HmoA
MWRLNSMSDADREATIVRFRAELEALVGVVPGLRSVSLAADVRDVESNFDVCLISIHESREALATYQSHPDHVAIGSWWGNLVAERGAVDSEV